MKRLVAFALIASLFAVSVVPVAADQLKDTQKQKKSVDSKLQSISKQKTEVSKNMKAAALEKAALEAKKKQEEKERQEKEKELKLVQDEITKIETDLQAAEDTYAQKKELFKKRLKVMYQNSNRSVIETLIEARNISDFFTRLHMLSVIAERDKELAEDLLVAKQDVEYKREMKLGEHEEKQAEAFEIKQNINTLSAKAARAQDKLQELEKLKKKLESEEDKLLAESDKLTKQLAKLSKGKYSGTMIWPVPSSSSISSGYGMRIHPVYKKRKMHTGIDINAKSGVSIIAANKGTVVFSGYKNGYGKTVIIDHGGGIMTLYAHCSRLLVSEGDVVKSGSTIAKVGSTGISTGPHLHFEVRIKGETTNPIKYVSP
jgi:murein DD-endopeptidase MepM/ murein hydrolase activator NlpD